MEPYFPSPTKVATNSVEPLLLSGMQIEKYCSKLYEAVKSFGVGLVKYQQYS